MAANCTPFQNGLKNGKVMSKMILKQSSLPSPDNISTNTNGLTASEKQINIALSTQMFIIIILI